MNKLLNAAIGLTTVIAAATAGADTYQWCGAASGSKMTNANVWSNTVTGAKATIGNKGGDYSNVIVFDCDALGVDRISVESPNDGWMLGELRILSGTVDISSLYMQSRYINFGNLTNEIYVAEGATLVITNGFSIAGPLNGDPAYATVVKTGGGKIVTGGRTRIGGAKGDNAGTYPVLRDFCFKEGEIEYDSAADGIYLAGAFRIGPGRSFALESDKIENETVVHVEKGGSLTLVSDTLGAITGDGDVTITGRVNLNMPEGKGPFAFGGRMSGRLIVISETTAVENGYYLLTSSNAFENVQFEAKALEGGKLLRFAPGLGVFHVGLYYNADKQPLFLEDTDGRPVRVYAGVNNSSTAYTAGSGDLFITSASGYEYSRDALSHTGWIAALNGYCNVTLGTGKEGEDVDLSRFAGFYNQTFSQGMYFKNYAEYVVPGLVAGEGYFHLYGPVTFDAFKTSSGVLNVYTNVTLRNPDAMLTVINLKTNASLCVEGGSLTGDASNNGQITLDGNPGTKLTVSNAVVAIDRCKAREIDFGYGSTWRIAYVLGDTGTEAEPQNIRLDDVDVWFGNRDFESFESAIGSVNTSKAVRNVYVGEGGVRFNMRSKSYWHGTNIGTLFPEEAGADGGVEVRGHGWLRIDGTWSGLTGPVRILGTYFQPNYENFELKGDVELGTTVVYFDPTTPMPIRHFFASASGSKMTVSGSAALKIYRPDNTSSSTFVIGPSDAAADSVLVRTAGGVLFLMDASSTSSVFSEKYAGEPAVKVNGGVSNSETGISKMPVFSYTNYRSDGTATSRYCVHFTKYDSEKGFVEVYGTPWSEISSPSSADVALVDSSTVISVDSDMSLGALRVIGRNGNALEIASGKTLTLGNGSDPACIILNNTHESGRGRAVIGGSGTIDFGAREGVITVNERQSGMIPAVINCVLAGSGGVTFASPVMEQGTVELGAVNTYSGGTYITGGTVDAKKAGCFGSGTVRVGRGQFYGGAVCFTGDGTWANDFTVQGIGDGYYATSEGAIRFDSTAVVLTGDVEILEETCFATGEVTGKGTFNGSVSGCGDVYVRGPGTIVFGAVNTYAGDTIVTEGTLVLGASGTFGDGDVVMNGATLRFENSADITVTNKISGTGTIVAAGTGKVILADAEAFSGDMLVEGNGVFDLYGEDAFVTELIGSGSYVNSGAAATLLATNAVSTCAFAGTISGPVSFVKTGAGVLSLTGSSTYTGSTLVSGGSLVLGDMAVSDTLPVPGNVFRLDANTGITLAEGSDAGVYTWADADGKDLVFTNQNYKSLDVPNYATLLTDRVNGLSSVHFDHSNIRLAAMGAECPVRTYFHVIGWGYDGTSIALLDGVFGQATKDSGVRLHTSGPKYNDAQTDWINGEPGSVFTNRAIHLFTRQYFSVMQWTGPAVGDYSNLSRPFGGDICEIIAYPNVLNATERDMVNDYLMVKWGIMERPEPVFRTDILPSGTDLEVAEGAVVCLNAVNQTVRTLSGAGALSNQTAVVSTVSISEDCVFSGTVGANIHIIVKSGATLTLAEGAVLDPGIVIIAEDGAYVDLSGQTFAIKTFRAGTRRQVINGKFVESAPWAQGSVIFLR